MASEQEKPLMAVGVDESEHSMFALEWTLDHFFTPFAPDPPFKLLVVYARPSPVSVLGGVGPGSVYAIPMIESDPKKMASMIKEKAKDVQDFSIKVLEGDARNVLCETVEKLNATMLVMGNHGYGALKRAFLGSVSGYCAHHAQCPVMIVKKPENK